ncbi:hypothetical protein KI387_011244, partial [Taxus chinensis]
AWIRNVGNLVQAKSGLKAKLPFKGKSFFGLRGSGTRICGSIRQCFPPHNVLYEIHGDWDGTVTLKDISTGKMSVIYDAKEVISNLKIPVVHNEEGVAPSESALVWSEVSEGILQGDWNRAAEAKRRVEEEQRNLRKQRENEGGTWSPKHFIRKGDGWDYLHTPRFVPYAPIIVP